MQIQSFEPRRQPAAMTDDAATGPLPDCRTLQPLLEDGARHLAALQAAAALFRAAAAALPQALETGDDALAPSRLRQRQALDGMALALRRLMPALDGLAPLAGSEPAGVPVPPGLRTGAGPVDSLADYGAAVLDAIDSTQQGNDTLTAIVRNYTNFYKALSQFRYMDYVEKASGSDGNRIVHRQKMLDALKALLAKTEHGEPITFLGKFDSADAAKEYAQRLFGDHYDNNVRIDGDNKMYLVTDQKGTIASLLESIDKIGSDDDVEMDSGQFSAWQNGYSTSIQAVQNDNQSLVTQLSNDNNVLDNVVKMLTGAIDKLFETARAFLRL